MDTKKIQLQKNANVYAANGQELGFIERVVVNPGTKVITDIVVHTGNLFQKEDRVVPIDFVVETTEDKIVLREDAGNLDAFLPLEEKRMVAEKASETDQPLSLNNAPPVNYGFPVTGPHLANPPGEQYVTRIERNIPDGTVAMKEGARVITAEGKHVGNVERVVAVSPVDQITHLIVSKGMLSRESKRIPITWVKLMGEDEVHLRVKKASVEELEAYPIAG